MTPEEQHSWEVIKALHEGRAVEFEWPKGQWNPADDWGRDDVHDIIANPRAYRIAKEEAK